MKKILYIHGLGGSGDGRVATLLREHLGSEYEVIAPEIPVRPKEALEFICNLLRNNRYDLVAGSSLGAFYLIASGHSPKKFVINPAIHAADYIEKYIGKGPQKFHSARENGQEEYIIDDEFINDLRDMECIQMVDDEEYWVSRCAVSPYDELFGDENAKLCKELYLDHTIEIHSSHRVEDDVITNDIIPKMKDFIDEDIFSGPIMIGPYVDFDDE